MNKLMCSGNVPHEAWLRTGGTYPAVTQFTSAARRLRRPLLLVEVAVAVLPPRENVEFMRYAVRNSANERCENWLPEAQYVMLGFWLIAYTLSMFCLNW